MQVYTEYPHEFKKIAYFMPSEAEKKLELYAVQAGRMIAKPSFKSGPRFANHHTVHFVVEGHVRYLYGDHQVELKQNDMFCLFPGITLQYQVIPECPSLKMAWIALHGENVKTFLRLIGISSDRPYLREAMLPDFPDQFEQFLQEYQQLNAQNPFLFSIGKIFDMFSRLTAESRTGTVSKARKEWVDQSITFMKLHYRDNIKIRDVADYIGLTRSHFATAFAKEVGCTPLEYLTKIRLSAGAKLLEQSSHSISEIAVSLGYPDLYTFSKSFHKQFGTSPKSYRASAVRDQIMF
ncbi:MAG: AraC family transcriptional regulator [Paenibacillaceae bacterium]|jgi:AraC-like DNA-binding protein|nr:AraC family transcriptional regulator [Paenibacillaceae bacterium]